MYKVLKFGGSSLGNSKRLKQVANIIKTIEGKKIVVLSAMQGTTDILDIICGLALKQKNNEVNNQISCLKERYFKTINELQLNNLILNHINKLFNELINIINSEKYYNFKKEILSYGEIITSYIFYNLLKKYNFNVSLISALDFMFLNDNREPDYPKIFKSLKKILSNKKQEIIITQGYICRNIKGEVDNLQRGGSDYTATIISNVIDANEVQIWSDIDGIHNNDPRYVKNTFAIDSLSYEEASELAYFGAKILHPQCVYPAQIKNIPIYLKNTFSPQKKGTLISNTSTPKVRGEIKAIAAKDKITVIKIKSHRMLMAYGFLRKIFEVFERYKTSVDLITTSEVAVSLTIDNDTYLKEIINELNYFGSIEYKKKQCIICIVGDFIAEKSGLAAKIFNALENIPLRMICYGGSEHNISILIDSSYKRDALLVLNKSLFKNNEYVL